jgi:hypothetical protein
MKEIIKQKIRKAKSRIRNMLSLDLMLDELVTNGSKDYEEEITKRYDPNIHEACEHISINLVYEHVDNKIKGPIIEGTKKQDIEKIIKNIGAKAYILGASGCIHLDSKEPFITCTSVSFYKLRGS